MKKNRRLGGYRTNNSISEEKIIKNLYLYKKYGSVSKIQEHATISYTSLERYRSAINGMIECRHEKKEIREQKIREALEKQKFHSRETREKLEKIAENYDTPILKKEIDRMEEYPKSNNLIERKILNAIKKCHGIFRDVKIMVPYAPQKISAVAEKYGINLIKYGGKHLYPQKRKTINENQFNPDSIPLDDIISGSKI
ncbi:hypothetical protein COS75_02790 [Candidatus Pacearchaeota archaeon CG06_land_8_20_14_3_00_35_12]|nr:MAG: hypothetical protein COS75_02790 [Candidatus Pacearchaeota archaeon CG06_land_8_20_14_3_00_35_12]